MSLDAIRDSDEETDVCLILEGTYPYVQGGVSSWVHRLVSDLPEIRFSIFHIGATGTPPPPVRYKPPNNVRVFSEMFLFDPPDPKSGKPAKTPPAMKEAIYDGFRRLLDAPDLPTRTACFEELCLMLVDARDDFNFGNFVEDDEAWDLLVSTCEKTGTDRPFSEFYWNIRGLALQFRRLLRDVDRIPKASVYHCCSTGYAGFLGALASRRRGSPLVLTEHGIYTKERIIEISHSRLIREEEREVFNAENDPGSMKSLWIAVFDILGRMAYDRAPIILTLFEGNGRLQVAFGAPPEKIEVLPNGIIPEEFEGLRKKREARLAAADPEKPVIGFVGRVVPIKDVKTLVRAAEIVLKRKPGATFLIVGPQDEDPEYAEGCKALAASLALGDRVVFTGPKRLHDFLDQLDIMVLTSASEGQPLTILEAFAAGIPCVATDVGSCAELILGRPEVDTLGPAGFVTPVTAPRETAEAILRILDRPDGVLALGRTGLERVTRFYRWPDILARYRDLYAMGRKTASAATHTQSLPPPPSADA